MNFFIKTFNYFKRKFLLFLLIDTIFFSLLFYFLIFIKNKLKNYLLVLGDYSTELSKIEGLEQKDIVASMKLDVLLKTMDNVTSNALFFVYIIIPIVLFLLFWIFHYIIFNIIKENKLNFKDFIKFGLISIPFFVAYIFIFLGFLNIIESFFEGEYLSLLFKFLFYLILLLIVGYYNFVVYSLNKYKIKDLIKKSFKISLKKFYVLMPLFLLLSIILLIISIPFFYLFIKQSILGLENKDFYYIFLFLPLFLILGFYRMFLVYIIKKYE
jgi:hypothetical protein